MRRLPQMLDELRDMLVERLLVYETKNKSLPDRILVFRDGVSEVCHSPYILLLCLCRYLSLPHCRVNTTLSLKKSFPRYSRRLGR